MARFLSIIWRAFFCRFILAGLFLPLGNQTLYAYADPNHPFLPTTVTRVAGGTVVSTNLFFYTNVSQVVSRLTRTYFYDNCGRTLTTSNAVGETIIRTNDALGRPVGIGVFPTSSTTPVRVISAVYGTNNNSVTISDGTGSAAIVSTVYMDNDGHPVLTVGYPNSGTNEFVYQQYDLDGNRIARQQCSSTGGTVTVWATNGWTYDGLNRVATETIGDGATTTYMRDALGDVIKRAMPGGLNWFATYLNDGRMASEVETNSGQTARTMSYTYYSSGSPYVGLLDTLTDGRGTVQTFTYDDFRRLAANSTSGTLLPQQMVTSYQYDPVGLLLTLSQSFATNATGPATAVIRTYDPNRHVINETTRLGGADFSGADESWDLAGRRVGLNDFASLYQFAYQADGLMTVVASGAGLAQFAYANNGLLSSRSNFSRMYSVTARDGRGRMLTNSTLAGGATSLAESLTWRNDGRLASYVAARGDFTDTHTYSYAALTQRLTQESLDVSAGVLVTENYTNDFGTNGGLGILTGSGQSGGVIWNASGLDGLSRVSTSHDSVITRTANGVCLGAEIITGTLDGKPVNVEYGGPDSPGNWHTSLALTPGSHTLVMSGFAPNLTLFASTNTTFTVTSNAYDNIFNTFDGNGNVTQRVWISGLGVTNRVQTFTWDAFNRQIKLADRDSLNNGWDFVSVFDGLGRRLRTVQTMITNGVGITSPPETVTTIDARYDPEVEFLKTSVRVNGLKTSLTYGPDSSGTYGGMQGMGGLELIQQYGISPTYGVVQDYFGNSLGVISNSIAVWNPARFGGYGPVPGYQAPPLSQFTAVMQAAGWHGFWPDPSGDYFLNSRPYEPLTCRFVSPDPLGHGASMDLYSFCHGDPVNFFDPCGRLGMPIGNQTPQDVVDNAPDYIAEMQVQRFEAGVVNLVTLGIADPLVGVLTAQNLSGDTVDRWQSAGRLLQSVLLALPMLVPGSAQIGLGLEAGGNALIAVEETGVADIGRGVLPATEGQVESEVLGNSSSGQPTSLEPAPVQGVESTAARTASGNAYSVAYEMKLDPSVFGRSDSVHFNRANAALDAALRGDSEFAAQMEQLSPGIADRVSSVGGRENPLDFTWHHAQEPGAMQLVPTIEHTPGSIFWRTLHPDPGAAGGYSIWAIPAGAPPR